MKNIAQTEPARLIGAITGLAAAVLAVLVAFGIDLSEAQSESLLGLTAVLAPIIAGFVIRDRVTPVGKAEAKVEAARRVGAAGASRGNAGPGRGEG